MSSLKAIIAFLLVATSSTRSSVVGPALAPAPLVGPALSYAHAIPYNVPPFAASVNVFTKHLLAAPVVHAAPFAAGLLPPIAAHAHAALPAPVLPAVIPQARSIHPPSLFSAIGYPPVAGALAAPLPHAFAHAPHALAAPLPHAHAHVLPAPLPHAHALSAPFPHAHALAAPLPHAHAHALSAPIAPLWRR